MKIQRILENIFFKFRIAVTAGGLFFVNIPNFIVERDSEKNRVL